MTKGKADADLPLDRSIGAHAVFISHQGIGMKRKFANQLYHSLANRGIKAFLDMMELPEGDDVRPFMLEAARRATIQVPIFSSTYAKSKWCLDELVEMIKSTKSSNYVKVLPVFYDVKSEDLRNKDGPFGEAIKGHRRERMHNEETIQGWEGALDAASWLEGFRLEKYNYFEGELLTELVEKIVQEIHFRTLAEVDPNAVGLERRVHDVVELLHLKEKRNVFFLLLYGMGGIGKTTLARAISYRLGKEFQATSFVENCGDEKPNRIQQSLLNDLLRDKDFQMDVRTGRTRLKDGLSGKKVLIVLDDVKDFESIEKVIDITSLRLGSLMLVTSRSRIVFPLESVLSDVFKGRRYEVRGMVGDESLRLLCLHAFKKPSPEPGFEVLAKRVSQACGGLPLSLEVLGCNLSRRKEKEMWEEAIVKLTSNEYREVENKLMISYEALDADEREMFLDVACFLIGESKGSAEYFWDGLVKTWRTGLANLVDLCLVKVVVKRMGRQDNRRKQAVLTMHDQLRDLGRAIVKKSGKWSRVWDNDDLLQVWRSKQGLDQIRGLATSLPKLNVGLLSQMRCLQLLFLHGTQLDGDYEGLKRLEIRWLKSRASFIPPENVSDMKFLTVLEGVPFFHGDEMEFSVSMRRGNLLNVLRRTIPTLPSSFGHLKKLREFRMSHCIALKQLPEDFGSLESLEVLDIWGSKIKKLPSSFGQLKKLRVLQMEYCTQLEQLPEDFGSLESLEMLDISHAGKIRKLPLSFGQLKKLWKLEMTSCSQLKQLPEDFGSLESLKWLNIRFAEDIEKLPSSFGQLKKLRMLQIDYCTQLKQLPGDFGSLESLEWLNIGRDRNIEKLPSSFWQLKKLRKLEMSTCSQLKQLPEDLGSLESLEVLHMWESEMKKLPSSFRQLKRLRELRMPTAELKQLPEDFGFLKSLEVLDISCCVDIEKLPSSFGQLKKLRELSMCCCLQLKQLPEDFGSLESLEVLDINHARDVRKLPFSFGQLKKLYGSLRCLFAAS